MKFKFGDHVRTTAPVGSVPADTFAVIIDTSPTQLDYRIQFEHRYYAYFVSANEIKPAND